MTIRINSKRRVARLTLEASTTINRSYDGVAAYLAAATAKREAQEWVDKHGRDLEVYACERHGGYLFHVAEVDR